MFVNQPDDAQLVALWHDPETCPAIVRTLIYLKRFGADACGALASTNKSLAQMNKSQAVSKATNRSAARSTLPTAMGAVLKMSGSSMSDEFDSLDASEKAGVEGALNNAKRPSDDVVQTAPVKCRYTKSGICANIAGFCLCTQASFALPRKQSSGIGAEQGNICRGGSVGTLPNA